MTESNIMHIKSASERFTCCWCAEHIDKGMPYFRSTLTDGATPGTMVTATTRWHDECRHAAMRALMSRRRTTPFAFGRMKRGTLKLLPYRIIDGYKLKIT